MTELKPIDYRLLFELIRDAKQSDRQLAKMIGVSQPTITRRRTNIQREVIDGYTVVPKWGKLGYEIFAITLVKIKADLATKEKYATVRKRGSEWLMSQPRILMAGACRGMGVDSFMMSVHKSYADYDEFIGNYRLEMGDFVDDLRSILVNLVGKELLKPFHFKYLAEEQPQHG